MIITGVFMECGQEQSRMLPNITLMVQLPDTGTGVMPMMYLQIMEE